MKYFVIFLIFIGFSGIAYAMHDPNQPIPHSIILPPDLKDAPFDEFMEWCMPYYGDKCIELEKKRSPIILSPLKQIKSGISIDEIKCNDNLILIQKYDGSSACVFPESIQKLVERGWIGNIIKIEPEIMNEIKSTSIAKYALDPEFEVQRDIAKEIFKSLRTGEDTPYISFGLSNDRKSLDLYFDKTVFTIEKNEAYYQEFIDESFAEITIPINVIFVEGKGRGDE